MNIPAVAWEQAVFLVLFVVFVAGVGAWFRKLSDQWQKTIIDLNTYWAEYNERQKKYSDDKLTQLEKQVIVMSKAIMALVQIIKDKNI
jgi:type IV secretory pathway TraG/TraD family ATPase VirD4